LIESVGAQLWYLPAYSPDLNPIEKMWSKIKSILRTLKARTKEALIYSIAKALDMVNASDAKGWFNSCGYTFS
jgi:transposase